MIRYFNMRTCYGVETIDELSSEDFTTIKAYKTELRRLTQEYQLSGHPVYISQRCDKDWKNK